MIKGIFSIIIFTLFLCIIGFISYVIKAVIGYRKNNEIIEQMKEDEKEFKAKIDKLENQITNLIETLNEK